MKRQGFTIVEMIVSLVILSSAILGLGASAGFMVRTATQAGVKAQALQAVESRLSQIVMDPRYQTLSSLYEGKETELPGLEGFERETTITHTRTEMNGRYTDYKEVTVSVSGPGLGEAVSRTLIVAVP